MPKHLCNAFWRVAMLSGCEICCDQPHWAFFQVVLLLNLHILYSSIACSYHDSAIIKSRYYPGSNCVL